MNDKGVSLPNTLTPEMKAEIETMTALSGAELDREFTNIMVAQHQKEVEMFSDQAEIAKTLDVKKYAEDLPESDVVRAPTRVTSDWGW